jgi:hypothetical protein
MYGSAIAKLKGIHKKTAHAGFEWELNWTLILDIVLRGQIILEWSQKSRETCWMLLFPWKNLIYDQEYKVCARSCWPAGHPPLMVLLLYEGEGTIGYALREDRYCDLGVKAASVWAYVSRSFCRERRPKHSRNTLSFTLYNNPRSITSL